MLRRPVLDEQSLPLVTACGLNMPCPDLLTPQRAAAAIWTWAPGQPQNADGAASWPQRILRFWQSLRGLLGFQVRHIAVPEAVLARKARHCIRCLNASSFYLNINMFSGEASLFLQIPLDRMNLDSPPLQNFRILRCMTH